MRLGGGGLGYICCLGQYYISKQRRGLHKVGHGFQTVVRDTHVPTSTLRISGNSNFLHTRCARVGACVQCIPSKHTRVCFLVCYHEY